MADRIRLDMEHFSLPSLLRYEDKNAMAFSVESRTPYLDVRFVEYIASLPLNMKIQFGWTKYILRHAMKNVLPESVRCRRSKLGFDTPIHQWITGPLKNEFVNTFKYGSFLSTYFQQDILIKEFENLCSNRTYLPDTFFFRAFILQKWADYLGVS